MKRLLVIVGVGVLVSVAIGSASARSDRAAATRALCHRTASKAKPYALLRVTAAKLRAHLRHTADIYPVPRGGCPRTLLSATAGGTAFSVTLTGEVEAPAGDPVGTGAATIRARRGQGQVCFTLAVNDITLPAAGAHVHRAAAGSSGPIVVQLVAPGASGASRACVAASRAVVAAMLANPSGYYVNVHTTDYPAGAIRGQLVGTTADAIGWVHDVQMSGRAEPNNTGDADGTGTATIRILRAAGTVCYRLRVQNIVLPAAGAHIHRGAAGSNGGIVVQFVAPGASGVSVGCTTGVSTTLIDEILANPAGFYVNVHTTTNPGGAIRAQLG
jgi:hypothetical protein